MTLSAQREAFQVDTIARGLDLNRSQYLTAFGDYVALSTTTFSAGMLVDLNSDQQIIKSLGVAPFGWAKYNKSTSFYSAVVGEYIQLNATTATNLAHANLLTAAGGAAGVRVAAALTSTAWVETTDYTVSYTNGTITRAGGGSLLADGAYVYVNYQYAMTAQELSDDGHNFWNFDDDVTIQGGKVTVITGDAILFTTAYDPAQTYTVGLQLEAGVAADNLTGYVTVAGGTGTFNVGTVFQVPTPDDPYLGIKTSF